MYLRNILYKAGISVIILFVAIYAMYKLYPIIAGPKIEITSTQKSDPNALGANEGELLIVKGKVSRAKEIKIFDRKINVDSEGNFEEEIIIQDLFTKIVITAEDKYGRVVTREYSVQN
jgi:hypothetical protein